MPPSTTSDCPDINVWVALTYEGHVHQAIAAAWFATLSLDWADSDLTAFATIGRLTPITFDRRLRATAKSAILLGQ